METQSVNFTVYSKDRYDEILNELKGDNLDKEPHEKISARIFKDFGGIPIIVNTFKEGLPDAFVYRVTTHDPKDEACEIGQYRNPPDSKAKLGRANIAGKAVFYCSFSPHTAITEMKDRATEYFYVSTWRLKFKRSINWAILLSTVAGDDKTIIGTIAKGYHEAIRKMVSGVSIPAAKDSFIYKQKVFCDLFTLKDPKNYHLTSAIAHYFLYDSMKQKAFIPILAYPSITKDGKDLNLAIRSDVAENEEYLSLESVVKCKVNKLDSGDFSYTFNSKAVRNGNGLEWKRGTLEITNIETERVGVKFKCRKKSEFFNPRELKISCGNFRGTLFDYIRDHNLPQVRASLLNEYDGSLGQHDFFDGALTYKESLNSITVMNPGLIAYHEGEHQIEAIAMQVDLENRFV